MRKLSEKEIIAAYLLLHCPNLTHKEISSLMGVSSTTLSIYKKRLISEKAIIPVRVPSLNSLGLKFLLISSGKIRGGKDVWEVWSGISRCLEKMGDVIFFMSDTYEFMAYIGFFTPEGFVKGITALRDLDGIFNVKVKFAADLTGVEVRNFLDLSQPLKWSMPKVAFPRVENCSGKPVEPLTSLTDRAKEVLIYLAENPSSTCEEIGRKMGISGQAVGQIRRRLRKQGHLHEGYLLNPRRFSLNVLSFYFIYPSSHMSKSSFLRVADSVEKVFFPPFFMVSSGTMHFIWPHRDLAAMKDFTAKVVEVLSTAGAEDARLERIVFDTRVEGMFTKIGMVGLRGGEIC